MIRFDRSLLREGDASVAILGPADVPQMLSLVELTQPGPFRSRTIELGRYIGVREGRRLVAMAGERMHVESPNRRAIDLYRSLGFVRRTEFALLVARRIG